MPKKGHGPTSFKKGNKAAKGKGPRQKANPTAHRPTNKAVETLLHTLNTPSEILGGLTPREKALENVCKKLNEGCVRTTERVLEYTDGPPVAKVQNEHSGKIVIEKVYPTGNPHA